MCKKDIKYREEGKKILRLMNISAECCSEQNMNTLFYP